MGNVAVFAVALQCADLVERWSVMGSEEARGKLCDVGHRGIHQASGECFDGPGC